MSGVAVAGGFGADLAFGDPRRLHPVAGFGLVAQAAEQAAYAPSRRRGVAYVAVLVGAVAVLAETAARRVGRGRVLAVVTWAALGGRSLVTEACRLAAHLERGDLDGARAVLPALCGRDPDGLDEPGLARAAVESVAENTSDAVVGALVWAAVAGPAGVAAYRAANTLDAMVGHRTDRYREFGWAAARLDDVLGWPAARVTALLAGACAPVVGGTPWGSWQAARRDGRAHPSPNAGVVEAAFAGALAVTLGGPLAYAGRVEVRPALGSGPPPAVADIARAGRLSLAVGVVAALLSAAVRSAR